MKKILLGVVLSILFVANSAFAMTFQQPVKIGNFFGTPMGGFVINGATQNNGELFKMRNGKIIDTKTYRATVYGKGVAQFGTGVDALYLHYDFYKYIVDYGKSFGGNYQEGAKNGVKFGGKNNERLISFNKQISETSCAIEKISTNENLALYMLIYNPAAGSRDYILIGRRADGTWVKYFDMEGINVKYFGLSKDNYGTTMGNRCPIIYEKYRCQGDTIIIDYKRSRGKSGYVKEGEFRFKWDEHAQWFGVEHIVY